MSAQKDLRFLLVDDHTIVRIGIKAILKQNFNNVFVAEAWDEESVRACLAKGAYDLIISDLTFTHAHDSSYFVNKMLPLYAGQPVVVLSMQPPELFAKKLIKMGVRGYLHKEAADFQLIEGIRYVLEKGHYLKNIDLIEREDKEEANPFDLLSKREMEVARLVVRGESLKMIAQKLNVQVSTISTFKIRIFEKLEIDSALELARIYEKFCPE